MLNWAADWGLGLDHPPGDGRESNDCEKFIDLHRSMKIQTLLIAEGHEMRPMMTEEIPSDGLGLGLCPHRKYSMNNDFVQFDDCNTAFVIIVSIPVELFFGQINPECHKLSNNDDALLYFQEWQVPTVVFLTMYIDT